MGIKKDPATMRRLKGYCYQPYLRHDPAQDVLQRAEVLSPEWAASGEVT
jgi:hypothetical protein